MGFVSQSGFSPGRAAVSGVPSGTYSIKAKISTAGSLGVAQVQLSTDGGLSYGTAATIPGNGVVAVTGTGVTLTFRNGQADSDDDFRRVEIYSVDVTPSTLPVTAWQPGSVPLTMVELIAQVAEDLGNLIKAVAEGGLLERASGPWLELLSQNVYGLERTAGTTTTGVVV